MAEIVDIQKQGQEGVYSGKIQQEMEKNPISPLLQQYYDLKAKHPNSMLLFQSGDSYVTLLDDAKKSSQILGITLIKNNQYNDITGKPQQEATFPRHELDTYLPKLIRAGQRVAICEQLEAPIQKKKEDSISKITNDMKKEADITASHNLNNHMAKKAETGEKEKKVAPKENAPQKTAATEQKVKEPKAKKAKEEKVEKPKAETKVEKPAAEKKEEKVKAPAQQKTAEQAAAPKEKEKLANGQTLDFSRVFQMTHIDEKPYGLKAIVDGVPLGTKVLSKEEQNAYFEKKITPAQLVSQKFERELKPENFAQIKEYAPYKIPTAAGIQQVNTFKGEKDGKDMISIKTADDTWRTRAIPEKELKDLDNKVATKEQVAAKLFSKEIGMEVFKAGKLPENLKENIEKIRVFGLTNKNPGDNTKNYGVQAVMKDGRTTPTRKIENNEYFAITGSKAKDIKPTATRENAAAKYLVPDIKAMLSQSQEQKKGLSR